jgi:hypothetical protein
VRGLREPPVSILLEREEGEAVPRLVRVRVRVRVRATATARVRAGARGRARGREAVPRLGDLDDRGDELAHEVVVPEQRRPVAVDEVDDEALDVRAVVVLVGQGGYG